MVLEDEILERPSFDLERKTRMVISKEFVLPTHLAENQKSSTKHETKAFMTKSKQNYKFTMSLQNKIP